MSNIPVNHVFATLMMLMENEHLLPHKNAAKSIEARKDGNKLYTCKSHNQEIHQKTLCLYNQSIVFAEENSEELALGYGNRSALLMHLHKYKECLIDIDRACGITKSEELKKKLATRRSECLIKIDEEKKEDVTPPVYNFNPSKKIPYASELVTIKYNEKYGRHVVATQDIQPGTVVFVEKGFFFSPDMNKIYFVCSHCLKPAWNGIPCNCCASAVYCSEKCKEEAWQEYHDIECSILPYFDFLGNLYDTMITESSYIRLLIKAIKLEGLRGIIKMAEPVDKPKDYDFTDFFDNLIQCNKFKLIFNLLSNEVNEVENDAMCTFVVLLLFEKSNINDKIININPDDKHHILEVLKKLRNILHNNGYSFQSVDSSNEEIETNDPESSFGVILAPFSSFFNHSCIHNVERLFTQNQELFLYSSNFIKKGEQLFVNYGIHPEMDKEQKLSYLKLHYNFVCNCPACTENWPPLMREEWNFDALDSDKKYSELMKNQLISTYILINKGPSKWHSTDHLIMNVVQIMNVIRKYYRGFEAYKHTYPCIIFIMCYFEKHYSFKNHITDDC